MKQKIEAMKKKRITISILASICLTVGTHSVMAQSNPSVDDLQSMDIEQLMNIKIESASKKSESLFDAPFASSVLTKEEIRRAGCTSIMEAFKLMPGLIVREQTNGNYDIHLRGLDNVPPNSVHFNSANSTTLVMIDNRPVYSYLQGGTFWETLPIDLNDVEKIEIVRGPSSAMYGPNAVSGVINIITRKTEKDGINAVANLQYGSLNTSIINGSVGYKFSPKLSAIVSANYQSRDRSNVEYYRTDLNTYVKSLSELPFTNPEDRFPYPDKSMNKYALNLFVNYAPTQKVNVNVSAGSQGSLVQNAYADNATPLSTRSSNTEYADIKFNISDLSGQLSYSGGTQTPNVGSRGSKYDFSTVDGYIEYAFHLGKVSLKPGYNFRKAIYDDTKYWDASKYEGAISGKGEITTNALSLRSEYKFLQEKVRLFGGVRLDKFNHPEKIYFSYELAANYHLNDKNVFRLTVSKANRSSFVFDTYINTTNTVLIHLDQPPYELPATVDVVGSKNLKLVTTHGVELGYRSKIASNLQFDMDVFLMETTNYTEFIVGKSTFDMNTFMMNIPITIENLPVKAQQLGTTISLNGVIGKLQFKPFVTFQKTKLRNYSDYYNTADSDPSIGNLGNAAENNYLNGKDVKHKGTPAVFGGAYINYQLSSKFNININPYYTSSQTFYQRENTAYRDGVRGVAHIDSKLLINARVSYKPIKQLEIFVAGKNLLGDTSREYYNTDLIPVSVLGGINFQL